MNAFRLPFLLFWLSIALFSCKKEDKLNTSNNPVDEQKEYLILGSDSGTINLVRIANPEPTHDTVRYSGSNDSSYTVYQTYDYDLYYRFDALQIIRTYGYPVNTVNQRDFVNSVSVSCTWMVVKEIIDTQTISTSVQEDSLFHLSQYSLYNNLSTIKSVQPTPLNYAVAFEEGDTIYRLGETVAASGNSAMATGGGVIYYHYQKKENYYSITDSIYKHRFWDFYYPWCEGVSEKYVVFSASIGGSVPKLGWIKLSIGPNGELTVHEVAYQP
jgi:hypothetical protein